MKVAILAGGKGSRLAEETSIRPKPMVEIGGKPILWHIMKHYSAYGFNEFVIALGYKGEYIKKYFADFCRLSGDMKVDLENGTIETNGHERMNWKVQLVDTGMETQTGARIKKLAPYIGNEAFMLTWGDGVSDVNLHELLRFHRNHGKIATMTAVRPPARYGHLDMHGDKIVKFTEKSQLHEGWINGAFFVLEPEIFNYLDDNEKTIWERAPLENLAKDGQLMAYRHKGFWQCMDTLREKHILEELWNSDNCPWKSWEKKAPVPVKQNVFTRFRPKVEVTK
ncbi:glucose-1-phosphate cytidylyltransferase [Nanoarchaeota archaeon]